jgi:putative DNA primase/helicase
MLAPIHAEGGGFHLRGYSSTGKTTALAVAASVWGPLERVRRWRSTGNGLEGTASLHNDALLCLDELAELPAKDAGNVAYMLANGQGKARASRSGELRQPCRWRTLFLSTGEISLADHMSTAGDRARAGQEVRIIDLPADAGAGYGLFDTLHDLPGGEHLSRLLMDKTTHHHGTAARAFIRKQATDLETVTEWADGTRRYFSSTVVPAGADGQVKRVADRFAIVAAAGELATHWGITGWDKWEAANAAKRCFNDWLEQRGGTGSQEDQQALEQVRAFFQIHGSSRFASNAGDVIHNRAGFIQTTNGDRRYLVFPKVFKQEVCRGLDPQRVARLLADAGHLITDGQHLTKKVRLEDGSRPRLYVISTSITE